MVSRPEFEKFEKFAARERRAAFEKAARQKSARVEAIEKDYWVCRTLYVLFHELRKPPALYFKGGTSLSKGYGIINRFSEDIDIIISAPGLVGAKSDPVADNITGSQRRKRFKALKKACVEFVTGTMKDQLEELLPKCTIEVGEECRDPYGAELHVKYPALFKHGDDEYLRPYVLIEAGARSAREPLDKRSVVPYVQEVIKAGINLNQNDVQMIRPKRTMLDKVLILHRIHEEFEAGGKPLKDRNKLSRHYYDIAMIAQSDEWKNSIAKAKLFKAVVEHTKKARGETLASAKLGKLKIQPPKKLIRALEADYRDTSGMIFGEAPSFKEVVAILSAVEKELNGLGRTKKIDGRQLAFELA